MVRAGWVALGGGCNGTVPARVTSAKDGGGRGSQHGTAQGTNPSVGVPRPGLANSGVLDDAFPGAVNSTSIARRRVLAKRAVVGHAGGPVR